ncbi:MAG TPA: hypothetical protein VFX92_09080 [Candidatus Krumholzibacteria bacterium]|nr:hypothetical protein [Candidatus Krumholzibacteria bacterium]
MTMRAFTRILFIVLTIVASASARADLVADTTGEMREIAERRLTWFQANSLHLTLDMDSVEVANATIDAPFLIYNSGDYSGYVNAEPRDLLRIPDRVEVCFPVLVDGRIVATINLSTAHPIRSEMGLAQMRYGLTRLFPEVGFVYRLQSLARRVDPSSGRRVSIIETPNAGSFFVIEDSVYVYGMIPIDQSTLERFGLADASLDSLQFLPPEHYYSFIISQVEDGARTVERRHAVATVRERVPRPHYAPPQDGNPGYVNLGWYFRLHDLQRARAELIRDAGVAELDLDATGPDIPEQRVHIPNPRQAKEAALRHRAFNVDRADTTWCVVTLCRWWSIREAASFLENGIRVYSKYDDGSFVAAVPGDKFEFLRSRPFVGWFVKYSAEMKQYPGSVYLPYSTVAIVVSMAGDRPEFRRALAALGAGIVTADGGGYSVVTAPEVIPSIAALDWVYSVEPPPVAGLEW